MSEPKMMTVEELIVALQALRDAHGNCPVEDHRGAEIEVARFNVETGAVEVCYSTDPPCNENNTHIPRALRNHLGL